MFLPTIFLPNFSFFTRWFDRPTGSNVTHPCLPAKTATDKMSPTETKSSQTSWFNVLRSSRCATNHALDRSAQKNLHKWLIARSHLGQRRRSGIRVFALNRARTQAAGRYSYST